MKKLIELKNISKSFGAHAALSNINLDIDDGEFVTLLGPSGCGKTTLLRILAGLDTPDSGSVFLDQTDITKLQPEKRHINTVFQNYALFPHMSVFENVAFGLRCQQISDSKIHQHVTEALEMVKLRGFEKRKPSELSGGQQQRVAIARAAVNEPSVLLLDEPLSALDSKLRKDMQIELKHLQRKLGITFILVTHDQEEALSVSDRVVVMDHGVIEQIGTPRDVYEEPINMFVANFIGETNQFCVAVDSTDATHFHVTIEDKSFQFKNLKQFKPNDHVNIIFRPEDLRVWQQREVDAEETKEMLPALVQQVIYKGSTVDLRIALDSGKIIKASEFFDEDDENLNYTLGEKVWLQWSSGWEWVLADEKPR